MEEFREYMSDKAEASTINRYVREVKNFEKVFEAETSNYKELSKYFNMLREAGYVDGTIGAVKAGLKSYFNYLIYIEKRFDNPVNLIQLAKRNTEIDFDSLLTTEELDSLISLREERYSLLEYRNKLIISLCRHQGLTRAELVNLIVDDYNIDTGKIRIGATTRTNSRELELKPAQVGYLMNYLNREREQLIKTDTDKLLITKLGTPESGEGITYIFETFRKYFTTKHINLKIVRKSVIAEKVAEFNNIRKSQAFAGHKYTSTTELYIREDLGELAQTIEQLHPYRTIIS
jgi:integrase/recombinase XerD